MLCFRIRNSRVADMETGGISAEEAAEALVAVKDSRRRARRVGYPLWFWLLTGVGLAAMPLWIGKPWLPGPWESVISLVSLALVFGTAIAACLPSVRGVRDCPPSAVVSRREVLLVGWPFLPVIATMLAGGIAWGAGLWSAPLAPLATAGTVFVVWAGGGLATTTLAARR
jgi:hypothetical protein